MSRAVASVLSSLAIAVASLPWAMAAPAPDAAEAAARAANWVVASQKANGAFFDSATPADGVAEAVVALVSSGAESKAIARAVEYIGNEGPARTSDAGWTGRLVAGIAASGNDPQRFRGFDYVAKLFSFYDSQTGAFDIRIYADALAILGVIAAEQAVPGKAIEYLQLNQCPSGGYYHDPGCTGVPEVDTTAAVICAMTAAGVPSSDPFVQRARGFLVTSQNQSGGFGLGPQNATNANSTGLALSAIAALGEDPTSDPWNRNGSPVKALLDLQTTSGGFKYRADSPDANAYATIQAIPGVLGSAYPVRPLAAAFSGPKDPPQAGSSALPGGRPTDPGPAQASVGQIVATPLAIELNPGAAGERGVLSSEGHLAKNRREGSSALPGLGLVALISALALLLLAERRHGA